MDKSVKAAESELWYSMTIEEVIYSFGVDEEMILAIVEEGIVEGEPNDQGLMVFEPRDLSRIKTVIRLERDLGVNLAGAALVLDLLQEIEQLKSLLR